MALLEVLDPAQNNPFRDHYLEVDLDLLEVLFIPTAERVGDDPGAAARPDGADPPGWLHRESRRLRSRAITSSVDRWSAQACGPTGSAWPNSAILAVITDHTREAGVRNLERELGKMTRKVATRIASGDLVPPLEITPAQVRELLGKPKFDNEVAERTAVAGVATGLAVTGTGGDVLFIEAANAPGDGKLTLTGQLGDVMKESAQIALSYVRAHAEALGVRPRDGPPEHSRSRAGWCGPEGRSVPAGVAMTTAIVSLLTGRPMRSSVAMTGEVTLQGLVLPIGGVEQKVLAAHRRGVAPR